ncbi:MAG: LysM peptidoglycan-binding domain-containing protein [Gammaproteobacteria bacterium]|nr:LysM peptidoglycan-binding domain-containing protein [Gammaproteobacteria bacterium]
MNKLFVYKNLKYRHFSFSSKRENKIGTTFSTSGNRFILLLFISAFLLVGCTTTYAPVEQRNSASYNKGVKKKYIGKIPNYHKVSKGDTLYSIAWKYNQDYKSLAYRNKIKPPYRIFVGDRLRLTSYTKKTTGANNTKVSSTGSRKVSNKTSSNKNYSKKSSSETRTASKSSKKVASTTLSKTKSSTKRAVNNKKKTQRLMEANDSVGAGR